jgi:hypothetical protein
MEIAAEFIFGFGHLGRRCHHFIVILRIQMLEYRRAQNSQIAVSLSHSGTSGQFGDFQRIELLSLDRQYRLRAVRELPLIFFLGLCGTRETALPPAPFAVAVYSIIESWLVAHKDNKLFGEIRCTRSLRRNGMSLVMGQPLALHIPASAMSASASASVAQ